jgi:hypothetical protein
MNDEFIFPQFVKMKGTALRLRFNGESYYYYYRDGGDWMVYFFRIRDKLFSDSRIRNGDLNNKQLIPITEKEWREDNSCYAPENFTQYGWLIEENNKKQKENYKFLLIIK